MAKKKTAKPAAAAPSDVPNVEVLEAKTEALQEEVLRLQEMVEAGNKRSGSATFNAERAAQPAGNLLPEFDYAGDTYRFKVPGFKIAGRKYTAADAVDDNDLIDKIVTNYPGIIEKL